MKKVLIFGACGFVGSYLCKEFINNGYSVIGCDIIKSSFAISKVPFYKTDITKIDEVKYIIKKEKPDIIVNLAAISSVGLSWRLPQKTMNINVIGTLNILDAVKSININSKILLVGSSEEYVISNEPLDENSPLNFNNPYGISKISQEQFARLYREQYGLEIYCVRAFNHTGIGQKDTFVLPSFCKQIARIEKSGKQGIITVGNIQVKRDFSHVKDVVRAYRLILENGNVNLVYNVGSGNAYCIEDLLQFIIELSDQKVDVRVDERKLRPSDQPIIQCDNRLIKDHTGWDPEYNVYDALQELFEHYVESL